VGSSRFFGLLALVYRERVCLFVLIACAKPQVAGYVDAAQQQMQ
jgi:hypothetical protein